MKKQKKLSLVQFNIMLNIAVPRIIAEATRLGVSTANINIIKNLFGDLLTENTWCWLWVLYAGGDATCTPNIKKAIAALRVKIEKALSVIYNDIPASVWNDDDRSIFGRATGAYAPRITPGVITEKCYPTPVPMGGAKMKITCKSATDQSRASVGEGANGVQIAYIVIDQPHMDGMTDTSQLKRATITTPEQCTNKEFFSGASFTLELDPIHAGRNLQFFVRWYNSKYPKNAGPWSEAYSANIS
jgi:hypothetical protein